MLFFVSRRLQPIGDYLHLYDNEPRLRLSDSATAILYSSFDREHQKCPTLAMTMLVVAGKQMRLRSPRAPCARGILSCCSLVLTR